MIIDYHRDFIKAFKKLPQKTKRKFQERQIIFEKDASNPTLNNHALKGGYEGYRSINVTGDIRIIFKMEDQHVIFVKIGSHSKLYG